ncbi:Uncharacterised protein [uncultured archaeon]|nr:Uncharacterised protein [uncultured archaeon]
MIKAKKLNPNPQFDFDLRLPMHEAVTSPGGSVLAPVQLVTLKGEPHIVELTATDWRSGGLTARLMPSRTSSSSTTTLNILVSPATQPGNYLFTVNGSASVPGHLPAVSEDTIMIVVKKNPNDNRKQEGQGQQNPAGQWQPTAGSASFPTGLKPSASAAGTATAGHGAGVIIFLIAAFVAILALSYLYGLSQNPAYTGWNPLKDVLKSLGPTRNCIQAATGGYFGNVPLKPDCSDTNNVAEPTTVDGQDIGTLTYAQVPCYFSGSYTPYQCEGSGQRPTHNCPSGTHQVASICIANT